VLFSYIILYQHFGYRFWDIFWIDASSEETIEASLSAISSHPAAQHAGLEPTSRSVLRWLASLQHEWLLVFNGADHEPHITSKSLPAMNRGNVLISTRNRIMCSIATEACEVLDMARADAVTLLLKSASLIDTPDHQQLAAQIVDELCCMALAVDQAGAAILSGLTTISDYLSLYHQHRLILSNDDYFKGESKYDFALYATWDLSFQEICRRADSGSAGCDAAIALFLLQIFAQLHCEDIPEELFCRASLPGSTGGEKDRPNTTFSDIIQVNDVGAWNPLNFRKGIRVLLSFSIIRPGMNGSSYSIHRLVHTWIKDRLAPAQCEEGIRGARLLFRQSIPMQRLEDHILFCRVIVPHVLSFYPIIEDTLQQEDVDDSISMQLGLLFELMGYYKQSLVCFMHRLKLTQLHCGFEHVDTLWAMTNLANTHRNLGNYQIALGLDECVLEGQKKVLGDVHVVTLSAMANLASTHWNLGNYQKALELQEGVLEERRKVLGDEHVDTLWAKANLANTHRNLGNHQIALELDECVLEGQKKALGDEHVDTLWAKANLASTYWNLGSYQKALELEECVLEARKNALGDEHVDTLWAKANLANTHRNLGNYQMALGLDECVLEGRKKVLGDEHVVTLSAMANLASTHWNLGNYQKALELEDCVLDARKNALGDEHVDTLWAKANLANTHRSLGNYQIALELDECVLEGRKKILGDVHVVTLSAMANLASTHWNLGNYQKALELEECVLEARKNALGDEHIDTLWAKANLANTHRSLGNYQMALELDEYVLEGRKKVLGDVHVVTLSAMANLASTHWNLGNYEKALELEEFVLEERRKALGDEHVDTLWAKANLANTHQNVRNYQMALELDKCVLE
jgi:tetratricopeptide (TPR) repeat protein